MVVCSARPSLWENTVYLCLIVPGDASKAQRVRRLIVAEAFAVNKESQGVWIREPAVGVIHLYLSHFSALLDFVMCNVAVWTPYCDAVKGCRRGKLSW